MNELSSKKLEFTKIKEQLISFTMSAGGQALAEQHQPSTDEGTVREWLTETAEADALLRTGTSVPLSAMEGIVPLLSKLGHGSIYTEKELEQVKDWLNTIRQMKRYMNEKRHMAATLSVYSDAMQDCPVLREELERCIRNGKLTDQSSASLAEARRQIGLIDVKIERKVSQTLTKYKASLQEPLVSRRNDHYVLPVKRECRKQVPGTVWDESASGQTLFIEPNDVGELHAEMQMWLAVEERERMIVLSDLSEMVEGKAGALRANLEAMASLDFIFARAKLSRTWDGIHIRISKYPVIKLVHARHPLLGSNCKPINVSLGQQWRQLMITGPNAGGKTITLKTIGLFAMMVQSGLLPPVEEGSIFGIFEHILADVGDGQSIEHSLSTFSAHMATIKEMLDVAGKRSLLLLDELAAGTDPGEGIALSIALLEELLQRESLVAATTHFNEIKRFAASTPGCTNARMAFDPVTLRSLYRLEVGEAGDSFAFAIARRFGLPEHVIENAEQRVAIGNTMQKEEWTGRADQKMFIPPIEDEEEGSTTGHEDMKHSDGDEGQGTSETAPWQVGDNVWIPLLKCTGSIEQFLNSRDEVIVLVRGKRLTLSREQVVKECL